MLHWDKREDFWTYTNENIAFIENTLIGLCKWSSGNLI